jgi:Kdo2-lipid IVA lauroyltransferase/acyltransferase
MGAIGFYIFYGFNWVFTLLPMRVLYVFSDFLYIILYHVISYRRKVVAENLRNSFPEKSASELKTIEKKFYRHLADLMIEILKLTHMSREQSLSRMKITNIELLDRLYDEGRDVIAVIGHYNNWEWLKSLIYHTKFQTVSIYKPLQNKRFDRFLLGLRERGGMILTPMSLIVREILEAKKNNRKSIYSFITDQTPPRGDIKYWTTFMNQDTPVYLGVEKIASKYDMAVVFFNVTKIKRGYYSYNPELLFEHTKGLPEYEITEKHVKRLEEIIREKPEYWIWSHRRWKHKKPAGA